MAEERLQKVLARGGVASRRHAEQLIVAGRVTVDGVVVQQLGVKVDPDTARVEVDGRPVHAETTVYFLLHKPRGVVTTLSDPEGRPTLADYLKQLPARVFPVGRLDFHTSGALLLTNDGGLANALLHPKGSVPKVYVAKVRGVVTDNQLDKWRTGIVLTTIDGDPDGGPTLPAQVEILRYEQGEDAGMRDFGHTWLRVVLKEGRNRQIHRMAEATGLFVMRLSRLSFAGIETAELGPGEVRPLTALEVARLRRDWQGIVDEEVLALEQGVHRRGRGPAGPSKKKEPVGKKDVVGEWAALQGPSGERAKPARQGAPAAPGAARGPAKSGPPSAGRGAAPSASKGPARNERGRERKS